MKRSLIPVAMTAAVGVAALAFSLPVNAGSDCGHAEASTAKADASPDSAAVGQPAPDFTLSSIDGGSVSLSQFQGKVVVLEWFNPDCPFVRYAYDKGPMAGLAAQWGEQGVVWLAINSSAPGKQGHGVDRNREASSDWALAHPLLLDEDGQVGKTYGATATPQLFVIDPAGTLVYSGALDDQPLGRGAESKRTDYLGAALEAVTSGGSVATPVTRAYGCSVKYAS